MQDLASKNEYLDHDVETVARIVESLKFLPINDIDRDDALVRRMILGYRPGVGDVELTDEESAYEMVIEAMSLRRKYASSSMAREAK